MLAEGSKQLSVSCWRRWLYPSAVSQCWRRWLCLHRGGDQWVLKDSRVSGEQQSQRMVVLGSVREKMLQSPNCEARDLPAGLGLTQEQFLLHCWTLHPISDFKE